MTKQTNLKSQLSLAIVMFLVSIFMTISYYYKIATNEADQLTTIAFYVWIFSIFAWLIKIIHDLRMIRKN